MAMRMPPQVAQQSALPTVNRSSLVFFGGLVLIVLNFYVTNVAHGANPLDIIFKSNAKATGVVGTFDTGMQIVGLALLTLMAEYGGEGAGSFAVVFIAALWLLWLVMHPLPGLHATPAAEPRANVIEPNSSAKPKQG